MAQCLASCTTYHVVPGSRPGRVVVRCGLVLVTFTPYLVLVKPVRLTLADCDAAGDYVVPNVLSPGDISRRNCTTYKGLYSIAKHDRV